MTNYSHFNLSEISLRINGIDVQTISVPYSFANGDGSGVDDYMLALEMAKQLAPTATMGNLINFRSFKKGELYIIYKSHFFAHVQNCMQILNAHLINLYLITGHVVTVFKVLQAAAGTLSQNRRGQVSFTLRFSKPLEDNVTVIVGSQLQTVLRIDPKTRDVMYE